MGRKSPPTKIDFERWLQEKFPEKTDPADFRTRKSFHVSFVLVGLIVFAVLLVAASWLLGRETGAGQYLDFFKGIVPLLIVLVSSLIGK